MKIVITDADEIMLSDLLIQYRILPVTLQITITIFFAWLLMVQWNWFELHAETMGGPASAAFGSLSLLAAGALKFVLESVLKNQAKASQD